jgi:DNA mismatch repair protein MSH2
MDEGSRVIEELLRSWANMCEGQDGEDVLMDSLDPEANLDALKRCFKEYEARINANPWTISLLSSL